MGSINKGDGGAPGFPGKGPTLQSWNMLAMFVTALVLHEASGELKDLATSKAEPMSTTPTVDQASMFWSNCVAELNVDLRRQHAAGTRSARGQHTVSTRPAHRQLTARP